MASANETKTAEATVETTENRVVDEDASVAVRRYFTIPGRDPFDEIEWELRDALIPGKDAPGLRAEERRVPEVLVADGDEHRRAEVLPRPHGLARARARVKQMIGRVVDTDRRAGAARAATSRARRRPRPSRPS